jgi:hypothetical protein
MATKTVRKNGELGLEEEGEVVISRVIFTTGPSHRPAVKIVFTAGLIVVGRSGL